MEASNTGDVGAPDVVSSTNPPADDVASFRDVQTAAAQEDDEWISQWAGGLEGLVGLIAPSSASSDEHIVKAVACLDLLSLDPVRSALLHQPDAIARIARSHPACWDRIIDVSSCLSTSKIDTETLAFVLHPSVAPHIPTDHPLYPLCAAAPDERLGVAWRMLDRPHAVHYLADRYAAGIQVGGMLEAPPPLSPAAIAVVESFCPEVLDRGSQSKLFLLVQAAELYAETLEHSRLLGRAIDLLLGSSSEMGAAADAHAMQSRLYLARKLPRLVLSYNIGLDILSQDHPEAAATVGQSRTLSDMYLQDGPAIADGKAVSEIRCQLELLRSNIIHGQLAEPYVQTLLASLPPLSTLPDLRSAPIFPDNDPIATAATAPTSASSTPETRAQMRLLTHLSTPLKPSGLVHTTTSADLVRLLAPDLYATLATARVPVLGIEPNEGYALKGAQASDFAGKVYGGHEFRNRALGPGQSGVGSMTGATDNHSGLGGPEAAAAAIAPVGVVQPARNGMSGMTALSGNNATLSPPGIASTTIPPANLLVPGQAAMSPPNMSGLSTGGGIGVGAIGAGGRISRPASRHVDDYAG